MSALKLKRWHPERVVRSDAGGALWAPVDREGREHGMTPTHDLEVVQRACQRLNDAHLIAVAPELFEALGHVTAVLNARGGPTAQERRDATAKARAALAKASGERP